MTEEIALTGVDQQSLASLATDGHALSCKKQKKKCCKKYKEGDQCRRCPKLAIFDAWIKQYYLDQLNKEHP